MIPIINCIKIENKMLFLVTRMAINKHFFLFLIIHFSSSLSLSICHLSTWCIRVCVCVCDDYTNFCIRFCSQIRSWPCIRFNNHDKHLIWFQPMNIPEKNTKKKKNKINCNNNNYYCNCCCC